jgi:hypothetical protein
MVTLDRGFRQFKSVGQAIVIKPPCWGLGETAGRPQGLGLVDGIEPFTESAHIVPSLSS